MGNPMVYYGMNQNQPMMMNTSHLSSLKHRPVTGRKTTNMPFSRKQQLFIN